MRGPACGVDFPLAPVKGAPACSSACLGVGQEREGGGGEARKQSAARHQKMESDSLLPPGSPSNKAK